MVAGLGFNFLYKLVKWHINKVARYSFYRLAVGITGKGNNYTKNKQVVAHAVHVLMG
jgi:hypothetical protein